jgi:PRTRC genetic system protein E
LNIIPKRSSEAENKALTTPLSIEGTPAEIDAELVPHLMAYTEMHRSFRTTLAEAKAAIDAATKAARDESRQKTTQQHKKMSGKGTESNTKEQETTGSEPKATEQAAESTPDQKHESAPSLF